MCAHPTFLYISSTTLLLASSSDEVFGTGNDPVNLKSGLEECSFNKLTVVPGIGDPNEVATGVIEVSIGISLEVNDRGTIRNAVTTAVQNKLGHSLPGPYNYILYSLEKCYQGCGWAAYAYINSWNSVYQDRYYKLPGVLMHEVSMCLAVYLQTSCNIWDSLLTTSSICHSLSICSARSQLRPRPFRRVGLANIY